MMLMLISSQISKDNLVLSLIGMKDCQGLSFILQRVEERVLFSNMFFLMRVYLIRIVLHIVFKLAR